MYQQGDRILYGIHGVCEILGTELRRVDRKNVSYFVLEPLDQRGSRFYVPSGNPAALEKLRPVLDAPALTALLHSQEVRLNVWIPDESRRRLRYREIISGGDRVELLQMLAALYLHRRDQSANGRKFHLSDENFLRDAEKILSTELRLVLGIGRNDAEEYLRSVLTETAVCP